MCKDVFPFYCNVQQGLSRNKQPAPDNLKKEIKKIEKIMKALKSYF